MDDVQGRTMRNEPSHRSERIEAPQEKEMQDAEQKYGINR